MNNIFETIFSCALVITWNYVYYQTTQTGSRITATFMLELFVTIFDSFHFWIIFTKSSILDVAGVLDPIFIADIFASHSWIFINLKPILVTYRNRSTNSNEKEDSWLLFWFQTAWENSYAVIDYFIPPCYPVPLSLRMRQHEPQAMAVIEVLCTWRNVNV